MMAKIVTPELGAKSFSCPHCGAVAQQTWYRLFLSSPLKDGGTFALHPEYFADLDLSQMEPREREFIDRLRKHTVTYEMHASTTLVQSEVVNVAMSHCYSCDGFALWIQDRLLYPTTNTEIVPHEEMPEDVKSDFYEAASIVDQSPRGAVALLRLCIQKIMPALGERGENLSDDISSLVRKGLDPMIQQALDVVRVIGDNAVRPGQIDLDDNKATALRLFELINLIVETRIAVPNRISSSMRTCLKRLATP
jgi:hypothetical protein